MIYMTDRTVRWPYNQLQLIFYPLNIPIPTGMFPLCYMSVGLTLDIFVIYCSPFDTESMIKACVYIDGVDMKCTRSV